MEALTDTNTFLRQHKMTLIIGHLTDTNTFLRQPKTNAPLLALQRSTNPELPGSSLAPSLLQLSDRFCGQRLTHGLHSCQKAVALDLVRISSWVRRTPAVGLCVREAQWRNWTQSHWCGTSTWPRTVPSPKKMTLWTVWGFLNIHKKTYVKQ